MITKELIKKLQHLVDEHESTRDGMKEHGIVMGEHEIVIDVFKKDEFNKWVYAGFSPNIILDRTTDGVYDILSAFGAEEYSK